MCMCKTGLSMTGCPCAHVYIGMHACTWACVIGLEAGGWVGNLSVGLGPCDSHSLSPQLHREPRASAASGVQRPEGPRGAEKPVRGCVVWGSTQRLGPEGQGRCRGARGLGGPERLWTQGSSGSWVAEEAMRQSRRGPWLSTGDPGFGTGGEGGGPGG